MLYLRAYSHLSLGKRWTPIVVATIVSLLLYGSILLTRPGPLVREISEAKGVQTPTADRAVPDIYATLDAFNNVRRQPFVRDDIVRLTSEIGVFADLFKLRYNMKGEGSKLMKHLDSAMIRELDDAIYYMEDRMFPFLLRDMKRQMAIREMEELEEDGLKNPTPSDSAPTPPETIADIVRSYKDTRGIVMTTGYWHFRFAFHAIHVIRTILKSELPIEIFYVGQQDLGELQISLLQQIPRVKVIDMSRLIDVHEPAVTGWAAKPYALLLSSFAEAIFVDADALFFQDPVVLFEQDAYKSTGVLLFRDRTITPFSDEPLKYFKSVVPEPSDYAAAGRLVRGLSQHDGESGVIVMNKIDGFFTLLLVCKMNSVDFRQDLWRIYHGDKETWWIAHELRKQPYAFNHPAGGAVGYPHPTKPQWVCGGLHHPDQDGNPLWFNGGIIANKYTHGGHNTLNLTVWATDYSYQDVEWEWETETSPFCMKPAQPSYRGQLKPRELEIARKMAQSWTILEDQIMNA